MMIEGSSSVTIRDVCVGEVWVGSGQSHMEMALKETLDAKKRIAEAKAPLIRLFLQSHAMAEKPLEAAQGRWVACSPETAGDFPAAAYYFALKLQKELGRPVGLLVAAWGGSFIESWMPRDSFAASAEGRAFLARWSSRIRKDPGLWNGGASRRLEISNLRFLPKNTAQAPLSIAQGAGEKEAREEGPDPF